MPKQEDIQQKAATSNTDRPLDFIRSAIEADGSSNRYEGRVHTRFPPEPSGYLHIGHAKAICLDFGIAQEYGGKCNLRFDDTNPLKEETEFIAAMQKDIHWLGFDWQDRLYYASDYFDALYQYALDLVKKGLAYVDSLSPEEIREYRGTLTQPGRNSPYRSRSCAENLDLLERMRRGEFPEGSHVLRAKIDMAAPNMNLRDPVMYRILHARHFRTGAKWCIYPTYDFTHGQSDSIEGITHSLCDVSFEDHRPLYDWFIEKLGIHHPRQIEFARLHMTHTVLSKRKLRALVEQGYVNGYDDPRMPTLSGLRRRGYTPESIREFCKRIGVAKSKSLVDIALLEHCLRQDLNKRAQRVMAVLEPLRLVIDNYPEGKVEMLDTINNPEDPDMGKRQVPFSRELYIERQDFREDPPRKYFRMAPGREVRLMNAYYVTCTDVKKDSAGNVVEVHASYDPATRGGWSADGRRVKGTMHWVSAAQSVPGEVRVYGNLFTRPNMEELADGETIFDLVDHDSFTCYSNCRFEKGLRDVQAGQRFQFLRQGYFCCDPDSVPGHLVFNRTVALRDTWAKLAKAQAKKQA